MVAMKISLIRLTYRMKPVEPFPFELTGNSGLVDSGAVVRSGIQMQTYIQ